MKSLFQIYFKILAWRHQHHKKRRKESKIKINQKITFQKNKNNNGVADTALYMRVVLKYILSNKAKQSIMQNDTCSIILYLQGLWHWFIKKTKTIDACSIQADARMQQSDVSQ